MQKHKGKILVTDTAIDLVTTHLRLNYNQQFIDKYTNEYYYVIYKLWSHILTYKTEEKYTDISRTIWRKWLNTNIDNKRKLVDIIKSDLITIGIVESDLYYFKTKTRKGVPKSKCKGFALSPLFYNNTKVRELDYVSNKPISKKLSNDPQYKKYIQSLKKLKIDYTACSAFIDEKVAQADYELREKVEGVKRYLNDEIGKNWILHAFKIKTGQIYFNKGNKVKRVYSNLTNLPSVLKQFCFFNKDIKCDVIDITNSQPLLINVLMSNDNIIDHSFKKDCENGVFYDKLTDIIKLDRDKTKKLVYKHILFGKHKDNTKLMNAFKKAYPIAYEYIKNKKGDSDTIEIYDTISGVASIKDLKNGNNKFAIELQNIEADIILSVTRKILHNKDQNGLTIHDAIFCEQHMTEKVIQELRIEFLKYNLKPTIK